MDESPVLADISKKAGTLGEIKEKEGALRQKLTEARREASEIISKAKLEGDSVRSELIKKARERSEQHLQDERAKAKVEAEQVVARSADEMKSVKASGEKNIPAAANYIIELVTLSSHEAAGGPASSHDR